MTTKFSASVENLSNLQTRGYKAARVALTADGRGGVSAEITRDSAPGPLADMGQGDVVELSNVNIAEEMVGMMVAQRSFEANVKAIKTADEMLGTLLDIKR